MNNSENAPRGRRQTKLKAYDYNQNGAYHVIVCTKDRKPLLWQSTVGAHIARPNGKPALSEYGRIVKNAIDEISQHYAGVSVDCCAIMPDHVHILLMVEREIGRAMRAPTVQSMIGQMKGAVTKRIGVSIWQKLQYDHVIRGENDLAKTREYINNNALQWEGQDING